MNYLLDTHIVIWLAREPNKLSAKVKNELQNMDNTVYFSTINLWEIALKTSLNKTEFQFDVIRLYERLITHGFNELTISSKYTKTLEVLPFIHKDPFDRMLIAQAMYENLCLITADDKISQYDGFDKLLN